MCIRDRANSTRNCMSGCNIKTYNLRNYRFYQRRAGSIHEIPPGYLPVLQNCSIFSFCHYHLNVIYQNTTGQGFHNIRNICGRSNVSFQGYKPIGNFSKQEYFNILFDFIPLCAGNSACFDYSKIFYRSCLDWLGLLWKLNLNFKELKIKKILVSQPEPLNPKSPYFELARKYNLKVDFKPFNQVEGVSSKDFRQQKINILDFTAVIFTSKTGIDHFFRICNELRTVVPDTMKYFCITENVAFYLQKYIVYRKRKIFHGKAKFQDLIDVIIKHREDNFFVPLSEPHNAEIPESLDKNSIKYTIGTLYKTISTDFSNLTEFDYDILVFYSPSGIKSLKENFPGFVQGDIKIAAFGPTTACAVESEGLRLDINAPNPKAPSMTMALDDFLKEYNKNLR